MKHWRHVEVQKTKLPLQSEKHYIFSMSTTAREHLMALDCDRLAKVIYPSTKYLTLCQSA